MPALLHDSFSAIFGTRRGTIHDPLVEAALGRISSLTNHLPRHRREALRLLLQDACLDLEKSPGRASLRKPILLLRGMPDGFRSSLTISVEEWLSEGHGYTGWKAVLKLAQDERTGEASSSDVHNSLHPLDASAIIKQVAYSLVYDWDWLSKVIETQDIA